MRSALLSLACLYLAGLLSCTKGPVVRQVRDRHGRLRALVGFKGLCKHGPVLIFNERGDTVLQGRYDLDERHGIWWGGTATGRPLGLERYVQGRKHGLQCHWWPGGGLRRAERYAHGVPEGALLRIRADGRPEQYSEYHRGLQHGRHVRWWYAGDSLSAVLSGGFQRGESSGRWVEVGRNGRLVYAADFDRGRLVRMIKAR